jgi:beta-ribofuranosylaminobenzene 5'-phosphate synthase
MFHLLFPAAGSSFGGHSEQEFFAQNTPISPQEVFQVLADVYHGLVPAFAERNLGLLGESLKSIQRTGFKQREIHAQPAAGALIRQLEHLECCATGLSSMGPGVYAITESGDEYASARIRALAEAEGATYLGPYVGRNKGADVS